MAEERRVPYEVIPGKIVYVTEAEEKRINDEFDYDNESIESFLARIRKSGTGFVVKDGGSREHFESGMQRDTEEGKIDYTLVLDGPMLKRWAEHMTRGAKKYSPRNWMKACGEAEMQRAKRSLMRHLMQYLNGERDEDHGAAIFFNLNQIEYILDRQRQEQVREL